jgi:hypothetical protein
MDRELQTYYEEVIATTNTPGWALLVEDAKQDRDTLNSVAHIKDAEHLFRTQGRIRELDAFLAFKDNVRAAYTKLLAEAEGKFDEDIEVPNETEIV